MAHFGQERSGDVVDFIVPDGGKASSVADHGMVDGEWYSTATGLRCVLELPVIF